MVPAIMIHLTVQETQSLRGESVFFEVTVENASGALLENVPTLHPHNHVLELTVRSREHLWRAGPLSANEREGLHVHGPETPETRHLGPGAAFRLRGDLLEWFGELPPGTYEVSARYSGLLETVESERVSWQILPAHIVLAATPRYGQALPDALLTAAFVHKGDEGFVPFYQRQGAALPRDPRRGLRSGAVPGVTEIWPAVLCQPGPRGHLLWRNQQNALYYVGLDADAPKVAAPVVLEPPFAGTPLLSPLSTPEGGLLVPYVDAKKQKLAVLSLGRPGAAAAVELDLKPATPLGAYVCLWDHGARLHFLWAASAGRAVHYARLGLTEAPAAFAARQAYEPDDPVLWLDAYVDIDATFTEQPYFQEQVPEDERDQLLEPQPAPLMLWCVTKASGRIVCTRVNLATGQSRVEAGFNTPAGAELRVLSSVVTHRYGLALLLADAQDRLYYASTMRSALLPVTEVARTEVTARQFPGLLTASESGLEPWVHLRYVEGQAALKYARLEPANEPDPMERSAAGRP